MNEPPPTGWRSAGDTHLLDGQLQQLRQAGRQHANEEGGGRAADVQHAGGQHRDEGVLPGEGVEQRQHRVAAPRQHTAHTERERHMTSSKAWLVCL